MAELKRNFSKARMNKDVDERLVPPGEYRDAMNIEISTSEGANVGTAQSIKGNTKREDIVVEGGNPNYGVPDTATCVASIANEKTNSIYYFVSSDTEGKDYILQYGLDRRALTYLFVDIFKVNTTNVGDTVNSGNVIYVPEGSSSTTNTTGIRIGMSLTTVNGYEKSDKVKVTDISHTTDLDVDGVFINAWKITLSENLTAYSIANGGSMKFVADNVLNFNENTIITGVSVLDDSIYWTDGNSEPKKINIKRSLSGTGGAYYLQGGGIAGIASANTDITSNTFNGGNGYFHTRLVTEHSPTGNFKVVTKNSGKEAVYVEEKHITVIKKAPVQPLELDMYRNAIPRIPAGETVENASSGLVIDQSMYNSAGELLAPGDSIDFTLLEPRDFRVDDILLFSSADTVVSDNDYSSWQVKVRITSGSTNSPETLEDTFTGEIVTISQEINSTQLDWNVKLDLGESLFEFKFPRFSYRYKYQDGEYSAFAPWSQIGFLPDTFNYVPSQGYNLGMINQVRGIVLKGYAPSEIISSNDISEIDILYKEDGSPTVYVLKTLSESLKHLIEWPNYDVYPNSRGEIAIKSDSIYSVVPSNQLLRPWDNVPRNALAQEISANRLIYGNYLQGYSILEEPLLKVNSKSESVKASGYTYAAPSIKSMREYTVGVTFSDKYGRETPIMSRATQSVKLPKDTAWLRNRLSVSMAKGTSIPSWAKYFSYYVKETSLEYYNLVMDRWYDAEDGNVWLSFPSSERNKVDEDTYIKLKKKHGSNTPVTDTSRYKIISIENEVPDHIKSTNKLVATLYNQADYVGTSGEGYPLVGFTYFTVQETVFEGLLDDTDFFNSSGRRVRFGGNGSLSDYYNISSVTLVNNKYKVTLENPIGLDAAFTSTSDSYATAISDLYIEFFKDITENKPEFNGRFFVKIAKDAALENQVLSASGTTGGYSVIKSKSVSYLNNGGYTSAASPGSAIDTEAKNIEWLEGGYSNRSKHPTEFSHHVAVEGQDLYCWGGATTAGAAGFEVPIGDGIRCIDIDYDPIEALNDSHETADANRVNTFWEWMGDVERGKGFFIDAATAFSWDASIEDVDNPNSGNIFNDTNNPDYVWQDWNTGVLSVDEPSPDFLEEDGAPVYIAEENTNNQQKTLGYPSRGIRGFSAQGSASSYSLMDISWSGMGKGYDGSNWDNAPFPHQLKDLGPEYASHDDFIANLISIGTKFKFQLDPDSQVYTVVSHVEDIYEPGFTPINGAFGIRNRRPDWAGDLVDDLSAYKKNSFRGYNLRQRWTIKVEPKIGIGPSGYNPIHGTRSVAEGGPGNADGDYRRALHHDATNNDVIEILTSTSSEGEFVRDAAIWETEPKDTAELDIYYQASGLNPVHLTEETNEEFIPIGSTFTLTDGEGAPTTHTVTSWSGGQTLNFTPAWQPQATLATLTTLSFTIRDSYKVTANLNGALSSGGTYTSLTLHGDPNSTTLDNAHKLQHQLHTLDWSNCWSYGNGVESDRIRDDFNAIQLDNGVKVSSTINGKIKEERRKHGLIWSGIYNSTSGINETNQFIMAEKITKDLNPVYGSIQALVNRDQKTQGLALFCEDKVLRAVTNKDALYNADGNPQLIASNAVIGDVTPYQGDFGIGTNPESLAVTPYNTYFTDTAKGKVLALSTEGVRPISDIGMKDYFSTYMSTLPKKAIGTYDARKNEYNITFAKYHSYTISEEPYETTTLSYSELSKGWTSFKSFIPEHGVSLNNNYYTFNNGHIWEHYTNDSYNVFYDALPVNTSVTLVINDIPESVKSFGTINYEGSQGKISAFTDVDGVSMLNGVYATNDGITSTDNVYDGEYFNLAAKAGWYVDNIMTDQQSTGNIEFKEKEGKWFGYPSGEDTSLSNLDEKELTVQGLGVASVAHDEPSLGGGIIITINIQ